MLSVRQLAEITRNRLLIVIIIMVLLSMAHDKVLLLYLKRQLGRLSFLLSQAIYLSRCYQVCVQHAVSGSVYGNWILFAFALNCTCYIHLV